MLKRTSITTVFPTFYRQGKQAYLCCSCINNGRKYTSKDEIMEYVLRSYGINPNTYLKIIRNIAVRNGYTKRLEFSNNDKYKFIYDGIHFGSSSNKDYIMYLLMKDFDKAFIMRDSYLKRTKAMKGTDFRNPLNKNVLSRVITWDLNGVYSG